MKLANGTRYRTLTLRAVVCEVHRRLAKTEGRLHSWRRLSVTVAYTRRHSTGGWAVRGGSRVRLLLQRRGIEAGEVAQLVEHELLHVYGHRHAGYCTTAGYHSAEHRARFAWADERWGVLQEELRPRAAYTVAERRVRRLEAAQVALARWQRRLRTATTKVRKYRAKVDAIERRLATAAAPAPPAGGGAA